MTATSSPTLPRAAMQVARLLALARAIRTYSTDGSHNAELLFGKVLLVCREAAIDLSASEEVQLRRGLEVEVGRPRLSGPPPLTSQALAKILVGQPPSLPVLYQRVPVVYVKQLGWPTRDLLFDRERALPYLPAYGASIHSDGAGNRALCIDLLPPDALLQNDGVRASAPDNVYGAPLAAEIERFCRNDVAKLHRDRNARYLSKDDLLTLAQRFIAEHTLSQFESLWSVANQIAAVCYDLMFPIYTMGPSYLQARELAEQLHDLKYDRPLYCAQLDDDWSSWYRLRTRDGMREYTDVVDCQLSTSLDGVEAACFNAFC